MPHRAVVWALCAVLALPALVLAIYWAWVMVSLPFDDDPNSFPTTADYLGGEVIGLAAFVSSGYVVLGLARRAVGRSASIVKVAAAYVIAVVVSLFGFIFLIGNFSGG